jgi:hypothetical protein
MRWLHTYKSRVFAFRIRLTRCKVRCFELQIKVYCESDQWAEISKASVNLMDESSPSRSKMVRAWRFSMILCRGLVWKTLCSQSCLPHWGKRGGAHWSTSSNWVRSYYQNCLKSYLLWGIMDQFLIHAWEIWNKRIVAGTYVWLDD